MEFRESSKKSYTENEVISMLEFLVNNIFVEFGWQFFQQIFDIPMGKNYVPLIADLFNYSYESEFMQKKDISTIVIFDCSKHFVLEIKSLGLQEIIIIVIK
jgi:hypothetical protein